MKNSIFLLVLVLISGCATNQGLTYEEMIATSDDAVITAEAALKNTCRYQADEQ
jgi:hypothetical protein